MTSEEEIKEDLIRVLSVICEWHSKMDCVADIEEIIPIANKHNIKLSYAKDLLENAVHYDLSKKSIRELIKNSKLT